MLLPSKELIELNERIPICLSGDELPGDCDIRYGQFYYFFMFNEKGELVDVADMSNGLTKRKNKGMALPEGFLDMVAESSKIKTSLESCEREFVESRGSDEAFKNLREKLKQLEGIGTMRAVRLLRENAKSTDSEVLTLFRALQLEVSAVSNQVINKKAIDSLALEIESFWANHPDFEQNLELVRPYLQHALKYSYDVHDRCHKVARPLIEPGRGATATELAETLLESCKKHVARIERQVKRLDKSKKDYDAPRLHAQLGNAAELVKSLDEIDTFGVMRPIHKAWREAADAELADQ